jgi:hypothetical protein
VTEGHVFDAESVDAEREMSPSTSSPPAPPCSHRCRGHLNLANKPKAIELWTLLDIALTAGNVCTKLMKPSGGGHQQHHCAMEDVHDSTPADGVPELLVFMPSTTTFTLPLLRPSR